MIIKASQRAGATRLADHLMNDWDNDHITLHELRGFVASDLNGALREAEMCAKGTKCQQYLFSCSFNPPKDEDASVSDLVEAVERSESALGLNGQPRAIVIHEKEGRRHAHAVWSRIDAAEMRAVNMSHFKRKLQKLSKELFLDHEWELPQGHQHLGGASPDNFTLDQWQQAQRLGLDPREIKRHFRDAWAQSDDRKSFATALASKGYRLAKGDRRGFVAVDIYGTVYSVPKWLALKTREVKAKLGSPEGLQSVAEASKALRNKVTDRLLAFIDQSDQQQNEELEPQKLRKSKLVARQRQERKELGSLHQNRKHWEQIARMERFNKGWRGLWDRLSGRHKKLRAENERDLRLCNHRDDEEREALYGKHKRQRQGLLKEIEVIRARHVRERRRLSLMVADYLNSPDVSQQRATTRQPSLHI